MGSWTSAASLIPEEDAMGRLHLSLPQTSNLQTLILHYCSADSGVSTVQIIPALFIPRQEEFEDILHGEHNLF